ncbi:hypothetical protein EYF80_033873 [Liparis tanakae]|uniref:Uncharacterized protein n=1 Tax=Liparis tanakae TaxID=230148 RepID=A0A4Z2GTE9_9TELE|nr:hypothetical protein EYF80_033873 [Liparis tanakae]
MTYRFNRNVRGGVGLFLDDVMEADSQTNRELQYGKQSAATGPTMHLCSAPQKPSERLVFRERRMEKCECNAGRSFSVTHSCEVKRRCSVERAQNIRFILEVSSADSGRHL